MDKVLENRLRRVLKRRGFQLVKSKRRDPGAVDYGTYYIADMKTRMMIAGTISNTGIPIFDLKDVEAWIEEYDRGGETA